MVREGEHFFKKKASPYETHNQSDFFKNHNDNLIKDKDREHHNTIATYHHITQGRGKRLSLEKMLKKRETIKKSKLSSPLSLSFFIPPHLQIIHHDDAVQYY